MPVYELIPTAWQICLHDESVPSIYLTICSLDTANEISKNNKFAVRKLTAIKHHRCQKKDILWMTESGSRAYADQD